MIVSEAMDCKFEIIWHSLEEETKDTMGESSWRFAVWNKLVNNVHFEIKQFSVDGVLRRSMEVILETLQLAMLAVLVEETNG